MKNRTFVIKILLALIITIPAFARVSFENLKINTNDEVLFTITNETSGNFSYTALFESEIENGAMSSFHPVSCFPERAEMAGDRLLVKNRYGNAIYDFENDSLSWTYVKDQIPVFASLPLPELTSSNGKWSCVMENTIPFHGRLVLKKLNDSRIIVLDDDTEFDWVTVPVKWSPDGTKLLYQKDGSIYFAIPDAMFKGVQLDEKFYRIGNGTFNSVYWSSDDVITYIDGDLIFNINVTEFTSLALYSQYIQMGKIAGRLPEKFNPVTDQFWTNVSGNEFIVSKGNNVISYYRTKKSEASAFVDIINTQSFVEDTKRPLKFQLFWKSGASPVLYVDFASEVSDFRTTRAYTISSDGKIAKVFSRDGKSSERCISPDGKYMAFSSDNAILVYSTVNWTKVLEDSGEKVIRLLWRNNDELVCLGGASVRLISIKTASAKYLFASSAESASWSEDEKSIYFSDISGRNCVYSRNEKSFRQISHQDFDIAKKCSLKVQNENYRVFKGNSENNLFENAIYIRTIKGSAVTKLMFPETGIANKNGRKASLVIDLLDNPDGLTSILSLCHEFNIRCTFFINGEFIRRYPEETKLLASSGHECASMFFTPVDLTKKEMDYDDQFILRGLARNEDEFFNATGSELSLWWHAPFNKANPRIKEIGRKAGYQYFEENGSEVDFTASSISVTLAPEKNEAGEIARKFELFVNEMLNGGYEIVTVSELSK